MAKPLLQTERFEILSRSKVPRVSLHHRGFMGCSVTRPARQTPCFRGWRRPGKKGSAIIGTALLSLPLWNLAASSTRTTFSQVRLAKRRGMQSWQQKRLSGNGGRLPGAGPTLCPSVGRLEAPGMLRDPSVQIQTTYNIAPMKCLILQHVPQARQPFTNGDLVTENLKNSSGLLAIRQRRKQERGTIIIMVAMMMTVLVAFMGLAFDASYMYYYKRRVQTAADAGAIAGAQELLRGAATEVTTAARKDAQLNRFTHGTNGVIVTVNNPPASGPRVGQAGFVEVIVSEPRPTWFMNIIGVTSATIRARAVAGLADSAGCVYALNRNTSEPNNGFFVNGTTNSTFNCGVFSNANFRTVGGACVIAPSASYSGTYTNASGSDPNCGPAEVGHGIPVVDPIVGLYTLPATSPCTFTNYKQISGPAVTLTPGIYCGGIEIGGSVPTATFTAGTYVLVGTGGNKGGLKLGSSVNATGTGVTFFNTYETNTTQYEPITINTSGNVAFSAPTSGTNKALLFYQDSRVPWRANNGSTITASSTSTFEGILYFPTTDLTYAGNSSSGSPTSGYTVLVVYNLTILGKAQINSDYSALGGSSPLKMAAFAE